MNQLHKLRVVESQILIIQKHFESSTWGVSVVLE